ncbi:hypothetical protein SRHO_G00237200 [Serrasalmus rhombeus]
MHESCRNSFRNWSSEEESCRRIALRTQRVMTAPPKAVTSLRKVLRKKVGLLATT